MHLSSLLPLLTLFTALSLTSAHPGEHHDHNDEDHKAELIAKRHFLEHSHRSLERACARNAVKRGVHPAAEWAMRRDEHIRELRSSVKAKNEARHLRGTPRSASRIARDATGNAKRQAGGGGSSLSDYGASLLNTSHHSNRTDITLNTTSTSLFNSTGTDNLCLLQPEATIGPYWVAGELIRDDITEDQAGVDLYMTVQFLDTSSCKPVENLYFEVWHCNSTGVYSGVVANGNGDSSDSSNLNNTFLRGLTPTDELGVATMHTLFPGHYSGRATHAHIVGHLNATVLANGTLGSGSSGNGDDTSTTVHIGQLFFDQDLISAVNTVSPYSTNDATITLNTADPILAGEAVEGAPSPVINYVYLGDLVEDGIYAWVTIGVNSSASYSTSAASYLTADGGVANSNSGSMGSGGGGGGNGNGTMSMGSGQNSTAPTGVRDTTGSSASSSAASAAAAASGTSSSGAVACKRAPAVMRHLAALLAA